jgi:hypothetical protein
LDWRRVTLLRSWLAFIPVSRNLRVYTRNAADLLYVVGFRQS